MVTKHPAAKTPYNPSDPTARSIRFRANDFPPVKRPVLNALNTTLPPRGSSLARPLVPTGSPRPDGSLRTRRPDTRRPNHLKITHTAYPLRPAASFDTSRHDTVRLVSPSSDVDSGYGYNLSPNTHLSPLTELKPAPSVPSEQSRQFVPFSHDKSPLHTPLHTPLSARFPHHYQPPELHFDVPARSSLQSATTGSSSIEPTSGTERSSILTNGSSVTDLSPETPNHGEMSVDDALDMYMDGFSEDDDSSPSRDSLESSETPFSPDIPRSSVIPEPEPEPEEPEEPEEPPKPPAKPRVSLEIESPLSPKQSISPDTTTDNKLEDQKQIPTPPPSARLPPEAPAKLTMPTVLSLGVPPPLSTPTSRRDQYGFKKETTYVTAAQYATWNEPYLRYVEYRRQKWVEMLNDSGLNSKDTLTFPSRSNKMKRYIRKGIPPEYRGAAWFWYAGGHEHLQRNPGLYRKLVERAIREPMNDDKEHIERDLHRTFPDNVHYKPDPSPDAQTNAGEGSSNLQNSPDPTETPIIRSLRHVLYAFSLHNPKIGYTQSLNFIAGLLLLFLPEEKAFWMLHIITSLYLPGTHEVSLEGANADLWILMVALKESLPAVYTKVASPTPTTSRSRPPAITTTTRLPDITLGLTNWLMSMFVGSLPLETTLRVWDILFYEGSKTFFRVALAIFRLSQRDILVVSDPMEIFQIVQTAPKKMIDASALADECFVRRFRFSQERVESLRLARRQAIREDKERGSFLARPGHFNPDSDSRPSTASNGPLPGAWRTWKNNTFR